MRGRSSMFAAVLGLTLMLTSAVGPPANSKDRRQAAIMAQQSPSPGDEAEDSAQESGTDSTAVALMVLAFGAVALGLLYLYLNAWRRDTAALTGAYLQATSTLPVYVLVREATQREGAFETAVAAELKIKGPQIVTVGQASAPFTALLDDDEVEATWSVDPEDAVVEPDVGTSSRITPRAPGPMTVKARVAEQEIAAKVEAVQAPSRGGNLPLVGQGYGGLWVALVAVTIAGALTAFGVLPGAALATLLGTVVSYFFVQRRDGRTEQEGGRQRTDERGQQSSG